MDNNEEVTTLLHVIADKYGSCDSERAFWELENKGVIPEPAIEMALEKKYIVSFRDDWGRTLVITPKGLEKLGRMLPGTYFNNW